MIEQQLTILLKPKLYLSKNSVICSKCTGNKGVVVAMAAKMRSEVSAWINGQQSLIGALIKDTGVLKSK